MARWHLVLVLALGCSSSGRVVSDPAAASRYETVTDVRETMLWILEPAAEVIWDSAGFVITAEGETDLSPTTGEGWDRVRAGAAVVAESGNLLMMPGRSAGPAWDAFARAMIGAGVRAMAAVEAREAEALFEAGGGLYQTCRACHAVYMVQPEQARSAR